ncbi:MAG: hypothetical protein WCQ57_06350 [Verrucomicrobiota bacterium]
MKKFFIPALAVFLLTSAGMPAQSTTEKVEQKTEGAVTATEATVKKAGEAVETAAKKTGRAVKKGADATVDGVKEAGKKTGATVEKAAKKTGAAVKKGADATVDGVKEVGKDVADSSIYKKIETELGKPFTPEQKQKYADAWKAAEQKARDTEKEFSDKISEITGIGKKKTKEVVKAEGL